MKTSIPMDPLSFEVVNGICGKVSGLSIDKTIQESVKTAGWSKFEVEYVVSVLSGRGFLVPQILDFIKEGIEEKLSAIDIANEHWLNIPTSCLR